MPLFLIILVLSGHCLSGQLWIYRSMGSHFAAFSNTSGEPQVKACLFHFCFIFSLSFFFSVMELYCLHFKIGRFVLHSLKVPYSGIGMLLVHTMYASVLVTLNGQIILLVELRQGTIGRLGIVRSAEPFCLSWRLEGYLDYVYEQCAIFYFFKISCLLPCD